MRFLVDAQLPPALARWLLAHGHEAEHVVDVGLLAAADRAIAQWVEERAAVLASKDDDFLLLRQPDRFALLWLRCGNATRRELTAWLETRWDRVEALLERGERLVEVR